MKILAIAFVYNELPYIEQAVKYYRAQGCDMLYVIDNGSTDGTWEWLQEQKIPSHRFNTQGAFHLSWLQEEMIKTIHKIKPDWFLWFAPDLFHSYLTTIREGIELLSSVGYNQIKSTCYSFKPTEEDIFSLPIQKAFRYAHVNNKVMLSSAYSGELTIEADRIIIPNPKPIQTGVIFEYGSCKPVAVQEEKLKRREKAWEMGLIKSHGSHYKVGKACGWLYNKKSPDMFYVWQKTILKNKINTL